MYNLNGADRLNDQDRLFLILRPFKQGPHPSCCCPPHPAAATAAAAAAAAAVLAALHARPEDPGRCFHTQLAPGSGICLLQVMQAACGPAEYDGGNRPVNLPPPLPETVDIISYI
eukprot:1136337-Pelagomonas_calceolata.AAC.3